jgi:hypothetical protein
VLQIYLETENKSHHQLQAFHQPFVSTRWMFL